MEIFNLKNICYCYPVKRQGISGLSFSVNEGESVTIIGANGSGKTTVLYLLDGLLTPDSGFIHFLGEDIKNGFLPELREKISLLFQNPQIQLFSLTVWDELIFGPLQAGVPEAEVEKRAKDVLEILGITHLKDMGPWNLSGGEMKKVALGTCLTTNPEVLLLDEPFSGLDPRSQVEFIELINSFRAAKKTIVTSTHDLHIIQDISERTIVLGENHEILADGHPEEIISKTNLLLEANLVHSHQHRHKNTSHIHYHFSAHQHKTD